MWFPCVKQKPMNCDYLKCSKEQHVVYIPTLGKSKLRLSARRTAAFCEGFYCFPQSLKANVGNVTDIGKLHFVSNVCWRGFTLDEHHNCRSQWPRDLRHEPSSHSRTSRSWVRIPLEHGCLCAFILCLCSMSGSNLAMGWSPVQGALLTVYDLRNCKISQVSQGLYGHRYIDRWIDK
jgi:hypothetical protein